MPRKKTTDEINPKISNNVPSFNGMSERLQMKMLREIESNTKDVNKSSTKQKRRTQSKLPIEDLPKMTDSLKKKLDEADTTIDALEVKKNHSNNNAPVVPTIKRRIICDDEDDDDVLIDKKTEAKSIPLQKTAIQTENSPINSKEILRNKTSISVVSIDLKPKLPLNAPPVSKANPFQWALELKNEIQSNKVCPSLLISYISIIYFL